MGPHRAARPVSDTTLQLDRRHEVRADLAMDKLDGATLGQSHSTVQRRPAYCALSGADALEATNDPRLQPGRTDGPGDLRRPGVANGQAAEAGQKHPTTDRSDPVGPSSQRARIASRPALQSGRLGHLTRRRRENHRLNTGCLCPPHSSRRGQERQRRRCGGGRCPLIQIGAHAYRTPAAIADPVILGVICPGSSAAQ